MSASSPLAKESPGSTIVPGRQIKISLPSVMNEDNPYWKYLQ